MPISPAIQEFERRLLALSQVKHFAFAAACAERVVTVHEFDGYAESDSLERAAELIWNVALGGKVSAATIRKARKMLEGAMPSSAEDEPTYSATNSSVITILNALDLIEAGDVKDVVRVSRGEYDAYEALGEVAAREHEQDWQRAVVTLLEQAAENEIDRNMFDALAPPPEDTFPELVD